MFVNKTSLTVYSHDQAGQEEWINTPAVSLSSLLLNAPKPVKSKLSSERYLSDAHFSKDATFFHTLRNSMSVPLEVFTQDYFIDSLRPFMHELQVSVREFGQSQYRQISGYKATVEYIRMIDGTGENLVTISGIVVPA